MSVDNVLAETANDVVSRVQEKSVGDTVSLQVARKGQLITVEVELTEANPTAASTSEG